MINDATLIRNYALPWPDEIRQLGNAMSCPLTNGKGFVPTSAELDRARKVGKEIDAIHEQQRIESETRNPYSHTYEGDDKK